MAKRRRTLVGLAILAVVVLGILVIVGANLIMLSSWYRSKPPSPRNDVPVVRTVGWWSSQELLTVDSLKVNVKHDALTLFNHEALVEYEITGRLKSSKGRRPYVKSVFISQRYRPAPPESEPSPARNPIGDFQLVPLVGSEEDKAYQGEEVEFRVIVQELVETPGWGPTDYEVECCGTRATFTLHQSK